MTRKVSDIEGIFENGNLVGIAPRGVKDSTLIPTQFNTTAEFNAAGGAAAYGVGPVYIGGVQYWCNASKITEIGGITWPMANVKNSYPLDPETISGLNSDTGLILNDVNLPVNKYGFSRGFKTSAGSGNSYKIFTVTGSEYLTLSLYAYCDPSISATINLSSLTGWFSTGEAGQLIYDPAIDNRNTGVNASVYRGWDITVLGDGWFRLSRCFKNSGTLDTSFILQFGSGTSSDKTIYTGIQFEVNTIAANNSLQPSPYVTTTSNVRKPILPFREIRIFSDSIYGSGINNKLGGAINSWAHQGSTDSVGGTQLLNNNGSGTSIINRFNAATPSGMTSTLVIINGGRNDLALLTTQASRLTLVNGIRTALQALPTGNFVVCGILLKHTKFNAQNTPASDGTEETSLINSDNFNNIIAFNNLLNEYFPGRYFDMQEASVESYDNNNSYDIAAHNSNMRPPTLTHITGVADTDNLHPSDAENKAIFEKFKLFVWKNLA